MTLANNRYSTTVVKMETVSNDKTPVFESCRGHFGIVLARLAQVRSSQTAFRLRLDRSKSDGGINHITTTNVKFYH